MNSKQFLFTVNLSESKKPSKRLEVRSSLKTDPPMTVRRLPVWARKLKLFAFLFLTSNFLLLTSSFFCWANEVTIRPDANFKCEFSGATGCTNHWQCVDEISPDEDTTYVYSSSTLQDEEGFSCDPVSFSTIDSIKIRARTRKTGLFSATNAWAIGHFWSDGELTYFVNVRNNITLQTYYVTEACTALTKDENGNNWTSTTVNNHGFGIKLLTNLSPDQMRLTWVEVIVYGTQAGGGATKPRDPITREEEVAQGICRGRIIR